MQRDRRDKNEMQFLSTGVHHGQDGRGSSHQAPPGTHPMTPTRGTRTPRPNPPSVRLRNHRHPVTSTTTPSTIPQAAANTATWFATITPATVES